MVFGWASPGSTRSAVEKVVTANAIEAAHHRW
jgi:hypothetical protein